LASPAESIACPKTKGAAPWTCASCRAILATFCQSGIAPSSARISMCEATESMRVRNSFWKPFITDRTTISAATPRKMPAIETKAMKETKPLRPAPRRARV
jgi:hypothetical protein